MANWYVWSGAGGAGTGADWANAYITLQAAMSAKAAGDVFFVAHDHVQTQATALTITSPGSESNPCRVYCVNRAGSVPPVSADLVAATASTGAQISTTATSAFVLTGSISECYGLIISAGTGTGASSLTLAGAGRTVRMVNCILRLTGTGAASRIVLGSSAGAVGILENTTVQFGSTSQRMNTGSRGIWRNTPSAIVGATLPGTGGLFGVSANGLWFVEGVDLVAITGNLISGNDAFVGQIILKDCKIGTSDGQSVTLNGPIGPGGVDLTLIRCASGDTNYRSEKYAFAGHQFIETTVVRSGGASDGTTPIAWEIATPGGAGTSRYNPFESLPISIWNETTGSAITVTVEGIWGAGAVPNNTDIWIDVEYLGTSGFPIASKATSGPEDGLASSTNIPAGSGTWGGSNTKFAMSATFTPQEKGPITITVKVGRIGSTFWIDPKPVVT